MGALLMVRLTRKYVLTVRKKVSGFLTNKGKEHATPHMLNDVVHSCDARTPNVTTVRDDRTCVL